MEQTAKPPMTVASFYLGNLRRGAKLYALGFFLTLMTSITEVMAPKITQWTIDLLTGEAVQKVPSQVVGESKIATLHNLILLLFGALLLGALGRFGWRQTLARQTHVVGRQMKSRLWDTLRHQSFATMQRYPIGDLMNRATGDWSAARFLHGFTLVLTLDMVFFLVLALVAMFTIDVELSLYCLMILPLLPRILIKLGRREHHLHGVAQEQLSKLSNLISQTLATVRLQRATQTDALWRRQMTDSAENYAVKNYEVVRTGLHIFPIGACPTLIAYGVLLVIGIDKIRAGNLTVGEFVALQSYVLLLQVPLFELGDCIAEWQKGLASMSRLVEIFNLDRFGQTKERHDINASRLTPSAGPLGNASAGRSAMAAEDVAEPREQYQKRPLALDAPQAAVEVRHLNFAYSRLGKKLLNDISLTIASGEALGILGSIGAGKTTFLRLIAGLLEPDDGSIQVLGQPLAGESRAWLTSQLTMVPQKAFLFAGTIRSNLELDGEFSETELISVLRTVQLQDFVDGLPDGLETWVGEWGINLSGGQKQRLSLARALLRPRPILLLDDCLSAVDAITEEAILRAMRQRLEDQTIVWVAHRYSTLKLCDRAFRLEDGRFVDP